MPAFQAMTERANAAFNRHSIGKIPLDVLSGKSFSEAAGSLGIAETAAERKFLDGLPPAIQDALKAVVRSAINREPRLPITFVWAPGYDVELLIAEAKTVHGSIGGVTVFLRTRYPGD
jgi:hypothetical protein